MRLPARKFFSISLLLLISALGVNIAAQTETAAVRGISFKSSAGSLEVRVAAAATARLTHFELRDPRRLVLDFQGLQNNAGFKERQIGVAGVERVRTGLFTHKNGTTARIVFDLSNDAPYRVIEDGGGIVRIVFGTAVAPLNLSAGPPIIPAELPLTTPIQLEQSAVAAAAVPILAASLRPAGAPQQTQITIVPATPPVTGTTPTAIPQYTGELVSLDLRDYDVKDFFRLISEISGLNVVLDPNVTGTVTLKLTDVPWDQALDVVLKNYQLGGQLQGNVLRIATHNTLQAEQAGQKALRDAQDLAAALETRTFVLNYTKADSLGATLQRLLSPRGTIIMDSRRNALIISDIPSQFVKVDDLVKFLDTPAQQVEIEARLLSATKSFSRELGSQLGLLIGQPGSNQVSGVFPPRIGTAPLAVGLQAPGATSGIAFLGKPGADVVLDAIITAAEARGTAKLISRPKVTTQNNQAANVSQGTQIPVPTITNATTQSTAVQFLNFSLRLEVTPQITEAGTIVLTAVVENSTPDFARAINGIPSIATQRAQTQVLIPDGGTAVIGGILVDSDSVNIRQVPGLGSLPVIGNLFKNTNTVKSTTELIFFITPRIKAPDAVAVAVPGGAQPGAQSR